jgi:hypothetical protein
MVSWSAIVEPPVSPARGRAWRPCRGVALADPTEVHDVERGSDKHSPRQDDELKSELAGMIGGAGGHREEWPDPEPPADHDPPIPGGVDPQDR